MHRSALCLAIVLISVPLRSQTAEKIPPPTGPLAIGRIGYHWVDRSRPDAKERTAHRELMVYFWYPAAKSRSAARASYLPGARQFDGMAEVQAGMRRSFGEDWSAILSGSLRAHAVERASVAKSGRRFPVVIFSHGAGNTGFDYSALIEDVVSHGYVVAAIEHTVCFLESPHRIEHTLQQLTVVLGNRPICLARELTKAHQEIIRGPASQILEQIRSLKGEFTLVVGPVAIDREATAGSTDNDVVRDFGQLQEIGAFPSRRALIAELAKRHGRSVRQVYALILEHQAAD